jgi:hypothetical protein
MTWSSINECYDTETLSRSLAVSFELVSAIGGRCDTPLTCWQVGWGKGWWWEEERRRDVFGAEKTGVLSQNSQCQARHIPEMECAAPALTRGTFIQCAGCALNVPGVRMYVCAGLRIYPCSPKVFSMISTLQPYISFALRHARGGDKRMDVPVASLYPKPHTGWCALDTSVNLGTHIKTKLETTTRPLERCIYHYHR